MKVLVCGSRDWKDYKAIEQRIEKLPKDCVVIEGGALGADALASIAAEAAGLHKARVEPLYQHFPGKVAPLRRNDAMLRLEPDKVIAFQKNGSRGTQYTIDAARGLGIPVEIVTA